MTTLTAPPAPPNASVAVKAKEPLTPEQTLAEVWADLLKNGSGQHRADAGISAIVAYLVGKKSVSGAPPAPPNANE
jgi:hypothetical protein